MRHRFFSSNILLFNSMTRRHLMTQRNLVTPSYTFDIIPRALPLITRNGIQYTCTEKFRANSNGRYIDVWLIYKTPDKKTWNVEIISRGYVSNIEPSIFDGFLCNDEELAKFYAFDRDTIVKSGGRFSGDVSFTVEGPDFPELINSCDGSNALHLSSQYYIPNKARNVLSSVIGVSGSQLKKLCDSKTISLPDKISLAKPFGKGFEVLIKFPELKQYLSDRPRLEESGAPSPMFRN